MNKTENYYEHKLIFACACLEMSDSAQNEIRKFLAVPLNWNEIIDISNRHQILPFLYFNLNKLNFGTIIPRDIFMIMQNCYFSNILKNSLIEEEISFILQLSNRENINVIPFRGFSLIQTLYHNLGLRIMVDVDILAKNKDSERINNILTQLKYLGYAEENITVFTKIISPNLNLVIEVHYALAPCRPYKINLPSLWERTQQITFNKLSLTCLSEEDTFLSLALHLRRHTRRITLKMVIDIAELLNANMSKLDWLYIIKSAKDNRIISTVYFSLYIIKELFDATVPSKIFNEFRPNIIKITLIHFCINKSNFFLLKKWQGAFLRLLLCDKPIDFLLYLWRVSFLERFVTKHCFKKYKENITEIMPRDTKLKIKK